MDQRDTDPCSCHGPGYPTPIDAMRNGPRETLLYVPCVSLVEGQPDFLATVDVDPESDSYGKVVHRLQLLHLGDEIHHSGWNSCSSCFDKPSAKRSHLILPCIHSDRIYIIDTLTDQRQPRIFKVIEGEEVRSEGGISMPHTSHCLPSSDVIVSSIGDENGNAKGSFILLDGVEWKIKGRWEADGSSAPMGRDFWYQPRHNVLISGELGDPRSIKAGFNPNDIREGLTNFGRNINVYDWTSRRLIQSIELGPEGRTPSEIRFLHNPDEDQGYVGCSLSSTVWRFFKAQNGLWDVEKVITVPNKKVDNWILPEIPGMVLGLIISLDDRFLYFSNWLHGDIRQYDITDRRQPKLVGQVFIGGMICADGRLKITEDRESQEQPSAVYFNGKRVQGGPQQLQLSLDGRRLYVTTSLYSVWDKQIYPDMTREGAWLLLIDVNTEVGGLKINRNFFVDFGEVAEFRSLANEVRYPGGYCTSDIWL